MTKFPQVEKFTDEELAIRVSEGSQSCFEELVQRYSPRLFHFLRHKTSADPEIEDLIQETFLRVFQNIARFNPDQRFSTWIYTIAVRLAISHYRSSKARGSSFVPSQSTPDPQEVVIKKEESENIWNLAKNLQQSHYKALWLRYAEDMSVKEIAEVMKKSHIQVRVLLHRARLSLARAFDQSDCPEKIAGPGPAEHKYSFL